MERLVRWPDRSDIRADGSVTVVTVNHNTQHLIALLVFSLYRVLKVGPTMLQIVVVDNGSTDGSRELLAALDEAGLCVLLANDDNRYHGPALNQALSHLAASAQTTSRAPDWVWVLDSDCVISRPDAVSVAVTAANGRGADLVGELQWDPWHACNRFGSHCLLIKPDRVWRDPIAPFTDGGDVSYELLQSCEQADLPAVSFPFLSAGYVIHRGRGTLAHVAESDDRSNKFYEWALQHRDAHFDEVPGAAERYERLRDNFVTLVPNLTPVELITACAEPS